MKTVKELNKSKVPIVILDKELDKLNDVVLFPEKVAIAKETIDKIGLPKKQSAAASRVSKGNFAPCSSQNRT